MDRKAMMKFPLKAIHPKERSFHYRVTLAFKHYTVEGEAVVDVAFTHGKRERDPHVDQIHAEAASKVARAFEAIAKAG